MEKIIAQFLSDNYVEDNKFRYNYSEDFIKWYLDDDSLNICSYDDNEELIGFICGKKINVSLFGKPLQMAEIDFLCIKKGERNKKLCPLLINKIQKKFNDININEAIFTSEHNYTNQITHCNYYIRFINTKKLFEINYINNLLNEKQYELPKIKGSKSLIKITNYIECLDLYNKYYNKFDCYEIFNEKSFIKRFDNPHIKIFGLVENNKIIDFISYYCIDIKVINNINNISTKDGYLYYYTNNSNNLHKMISLLLHKLKEDNVDSFIALDIMENTEDIMLDLKFINKKSNYNYYFFQNNVNIKNNMMAKILF